MCVGDYANLHLGFWFKWVLIALADYLMMAGVESRESGNTYGTANPNGQENPHQNIVAQSKAMEPSNRRISRGLSFRSSLLLKGGIE